MNFLFDLQGSVFWILYFLKKNRDFEIGQFYEFFKFRLFQFLICIYKWCVSVILMKMHCGETHSKGKKVTLNTASRKEVVVHWKKLGRLLEMCTKRSHVRKFQRSTKRKNGRSAKHQIRDQLASSAGARKHSRIKQVAERHTPVKRGWWERQSRVRRGPKRHDKAEQSCGGSQKNRKGGNRKAQHDRKSQKHRRKARCVWKIPERWRVMRGWENYYRYNLFIFTFQVGKRLKKRTILI